MSGYESEHTRFMRRYIEDHPEELESQKVGRAAWWDKDPAQVAPPPPRQAPKSGGAEYTFRPLSESEG